LCVTVCVNEWVESGDLCVCCSASRQGHTSTVGLIQNTALTPIFPHFFLTPNGTPQAYPHLGHTGTAGLIQNTARTPIFPQFFLTPSGTPQAYPHPGHTGTAGLIPKTPHAPPFSHIYFLHLTAHLRPTHIRGTQARLASSPKHRTYPHFPTFLSYT